MSASDSHDLEGALSSHVGDIGDDCVRSRVHDELGLTMRPSDSFRAAVIVGADPAVLLAVQKEAPAIHAFLVMDSVAQLGKLEAALGRAADSLPDAITLRPIAPNEAMPRAYLAILEFLLNLKIPLKEVFFLTPGENERGSSPAVAAVNDLLWSESTLFLNAARNIGGITPQMALSLADYFAQSGAPFAALKFIYAVKNQIARSDRRRLSRQVIRLWNEVQCYEPAQEWLGYLPRAANTSICAGLYDALNEADAGRRELLAKNRDALKEHHLDLFTKVQNHQSRQKVRTAFVPDASFSVKSIAPPRLRRAPLPIFFVIDESGISELRPLYTPRPLLAALDLAFRDPSWIDAQLVGSLGRYDVLLNVLANFPNHPWPSWRRAVYAVETNLDLFVELLHSVHIAPLFAEESLSLFVGDTAIDDLSRFFSDHPGRPLPRLRFLTEPSLASRLDLMGQAELDRVRELQSLPLPYSSSFLGELQDILDGRGQRPLRVMIPVSIFTDVLQHVADDMKHALEILGAEVMVLKERDGLERTKHYLAEQAFREFRPDIIIQQDYLRAQLPFRVPPELPVVTWIQDDLPHLWDPKATRALSRYDFAFAIYPAFVESCRKANYPHYRQLGMAANTERFIPDPLLTSRNEVSFIMNMPPTKKAPALLPLFDLITERLNERGIGRLNRAHSETLIRECASELGMDVTNPSDLVFTVWMLEREVQRFKVLGWLLEEEIPVSLYGRGWDAIPEFRHLWRGVIKPGPELARKYQEAKVILHMTATNNLHQRIFECLASGGLVIAESCPTDNDLGQLGGHLRIGTEILVYSSKDELLSLIRRAFVDEPWRQSIIKSGRQRVIAEHSYVHRMRTILEEIREGLSGKAMAPLATTG